MKAIVAELEAKPPAQFTGEQRKIRDLYDAFTDTAAIEQHGLTPAEKDLDAIAALRTPEDVARAMGNPAVPLDGLFDLAVSADAKHPSRYVATLSQSGLGMPNRDYYLRDDPALAATRDAYRTYLTSMLTLAGEQDAEPRADAVLRARDGDRQGSLDRRRSARRRQDVQPDDGCASSITYAPGFPWAAFFPARGLSGERARPATVS